MASSAAATSPLRTALAMALCWLRMLRLLVRDPTCLMSDGWNTSDTQRVSATSRWSGDRTPPSEAE